MLTAGFVLEPSFTIAPPPVAWACICLTSST